MEEPDEHASLVKRVKQVQRESDESKQQWWAFCELEGKNNRRDPQRHTLHSLRRFFHLRDQGGLPKVRLEPGTHQYLAQKLKDAVRLSADTKQKWWDYCEKQNGGYRDPQRHSTKSIETFFEFYAGESSTASILTAAATGPQDDSEDAAALAALSPEVTCVTVNGQKAYVIQFREAVFKALPKVLELHPLQAASVVPSTGIHAFQTCPQVPLAPTQAGQFPQFHPLPTMVQGGTQPEQTFPSSAHLVPSNPIQVTQLDATDGNVLPSSQDVSALPSDEQSLRRERSRTPKKKPRSKW